MVSQDDPFNLGVIEAAEELLTDGGLELVFNEIYAPDTTDFSAIAIKVADLDPDLIIGGTVLEDSVGQIRPTRKRATSRASPTSPPDPRCQDRSVRRWASHRGHLRLDLLVPRSGHTAERRMVAKYIDKFGGTEDDIAEDSANAFTVGQVLQQAVENIQIAGQRRADRRDAQVHFRYGGRPAQFRRDGRATGQLHAAAVAGRQFVIVGPGDRAEADIHWAAEAGVVIRRLAGV